MSLRGGGLKQWILAEARREIKVLCVKKEGKKTNTNMAMKWLLFVTGIRLDRAAPSCHNCFIFIAVFNNKHSSFSIWMNSSFIQS